MESKSYKNMNKKELVAELKFRGLSTNGGKKDLLERLSRANDGHIGKENEENDGENRNEYLDKSISSLALHDENEVDRFLLKERELIDYEKNLIKQERELLKREKQLLLKLGSEDNAVLQNQTERFLQSHEVIELIPLLDVSEEKSLTPIKWLNKIEEMKNIYKWKDITTIHYASIRTTGAVKLWLDCGVTFTSWNMFKKELVKAFPTNEDESEIHRKLTNRKKKTSESFEEYVYIMKQLASRADISEKMVIKYIINGLNEFNLRLNLQLQDIESVSDLLLKLKKYESTTINVEKKMKFQSSNERKFTDGNSSGQNSKGSSVKCFNCGAEGHMAAKCNKAKRPRGTCFQCGKPDHVFKNCPEKQIKYVSMSKMNSNNKNDDANGKLIIRNLNQNINLKFNNKICKFQIDINAQIDTGSPVSLIKIDCIPMSCVEPVNIEEYNYCGINNCKLTVLGECKLSICIENSEYSMKFIVVPNHTMYAKALLGLDFFQITQAKLEIDNINKNSSENFNTELLNINIENANEMESEININPCLDLSVQEKVKKLIIENYVVKKKPEQPCVSHEMQIRLHDPNKVFSCSPRRLSEHEKDKVREIIDEYLKKGIIRHSSSQYSSPIVLVKKKNGKEFRMCCDYRLLNKNTQSVNYPIPVIEDLIEQLYEKNYFTILDLKNGFFHVKMEEDSIKFTSFVTPHGQFEFTKMPFGLKNSPREFQKYVHKIFQTLIYAKKIQVYIDDILIASKSISEHLETLKEVLTLIRENHLELRLDKCSFVQEEIQYLGYSISKTGIKPNADKLSAIHEFSVPKNVREVKGFIGLCSYFRKFIDKFAIIAAPLTNLTRQNVSFNFGEKEYEAFSELKQKLVKAPVLAVYSSKDDTELHCDACALGYGAVLMQKKSDGNWHPIFYFSKRTTETEARYHSYELETLAIIYAIRRFRIYLYGIRFKVVTDCNALAMTMKKQFINHRINRWVMELENYDYVVEHRPSARMKHVDGLSRSHNILVLFENSLELNLAICQNEDAGIQKLKRELGKEQSPLYELREGLVYRKVNKHKLLFYVPNSMVIHILRNAHDNHSHVGSKKVLEIIRRSYWFPEMESEVKKYIKNCPKCIVYNSNVDKSSGMLHSIDKGNLPFSTIHIDHYGPLDVTPRRNKHILAIIDGFTKFVKLFPCKSTTSIETINCLKKYFRSYSKPLRIISDRGTAFSSTQFSNFVKSNNIQHVMVASGSPESNGQIERFNRDLTPMLSKLVDNEKKIYWDTVLDRIEFTHNNTYNRSIDSTPARLLFGINQRGPETNLLDEVFGVHERENLEQHRKKAKEQIEKVQAVNKEYVDRKHKEAKKYKIGDLVCVTNTDTSQGTNKKLIPKYRGPYKILKNLGNDRYLVIDVPGFQITNKPFKGIYAAKRLRSWIDVNKTEIKEVLE